MEKAVDKETLTTYLNQYQGHSRFLRLIAMVEKNEHVRRVALELCYEMAVKEKKLL